MSSSSLWRVEMVPLLLPRGSFFWQWEHAKLDGVSRRRNSLQIAVSLVLQFGGIHWGWYWNRDMSQPPVVHKALGCWLTVSARSRGEDFSAGGPHDWQNAKVSLQNVALLSAWCLYSLFREKPFHFLHKNRWSWLCKVTARSNRFLLRQGIPEPNATTCATRIENFMKTLTCSSIFQLSEANKLRTDFIAHMYVMCSDVCSLPRTALTGYSVNTCVFGD